MDLDIQKLAAETAVLLAPFLPYLIKGGKQAAKAAFEEAGKKFTDAAWNKAKGIWGKVWTKAKKKESAKEAFEDVDAYGLDKVETVYNSLPGWSEDISQARNYVKMIEDAAGVPVKMIGVGPEREATIRR